MQAVQRAARCDVGPGGSLLARVWGLLGVHPAGSLPSAAEPTLPSARHICTSTVSQSSQTEAAPLSAAPDGKGHEQNLPPVQPDLVAQVMGPAHKSSRDLHKAQLQDVRRLFQRFPGDCGSTEVQVAALTQRIRWMTVHMRAHHKDFHSRKGLEGMLAERKSLLQYLRRTQFETYSVLIARLGLKDSFAKQDRFSVRSKAQRR